MNELRELWKLLEAELPEEESPDTPGSLLVRMVHDLDLRFAELQAETAQQPSLPGVALFDLDDALEEFRSS